MEKSWAWWCIPAILAMMESLKTWQSWSRLAWTKSKTLSPKVGQKGLKEA
jgi:hypothetical protein